jgi:hypothetical protein
LPVVPHPSRWAWASADLPREYVAPMVSCRSPEEIQPSPLQVRDEEVGTAHYLRQLETDDGVAPRY